MKKLILLIISVNFISLCMDNNHKGQKRKLIDETEQKDDIKKQKTVKLIEQYKQELLKIVKPGIESFIAGSTKFIPKALHKKYGNFPANLDFSFNSKNVLVTQDVVGVTDAVTVYTENGKLLSTSYHEDNADIVGGIRDAVMSPCNKYVVSASVMDKHPVRIWDTTSKKCVKRYDLQDYALQGVKIGLDRYLRYIVLKTMKLWRESSIYILKFNLDSNINEVIQCWEKQYTTFCVSSCGNFILIGDTSGSISIVDMRDLNRISSFALRVHNNSVASIGISSDGKFAITSSQEGVKLLRISCVNGNYNLELDLTNNLNESLKLKNSKADQSSSNNYAKRLYSYVANIFASREQRPLKITVTDRYGIATYEHGEREIPLADQDNTVDTLIFDFSDPENIVVQNLFNKIWGAKLSPDNKYLLLDQARNDNLFGVLEFSSWIIEELPEENIEMLVNLVKIQETNQSEQYYKTIKNNFTPNLQKYIERYLSIRSNVVVEIDSLRCAQCNKPNPAYRCNNCQLAYYCSQECQRANWPKHQADCKQ